MKLPMGNRPDSTVIHLGYAVATADNKLFTFAEGHWRYAPIRISGTTFRAEELARYQHYSQKDYDNAILQYRPRTVEVSVTLKDAIVPTIDEAAKKILNGMNTFERSVLEEYFKKGG